jgi:hypothetical protein
MSKFNHFLFHLEQSTIASDRSLVPFGEYPLIELITEFGHCSLAIFEKEVGGKYLYLQNVDLLYFSLSLGQALKTLKNNPGARFDLVNLNQHYSLQISLVEGKVAIKDVFSSAEIQIKRDRYKEIIFSFRKRVWSDFLLAYPEMKTSKGFGEVELMFC